MDVGKYVVISVIIFSVVFSLVRTLILESNSMKAKHQKLDKWEKELSEKSSMLAEWQNDLSRWQLAQLKAANSIDRIINDRLAYAITRGAKKKIFKNTPVFLAFSNLDLDEKSRLYSAIRTRLISDTPTVTWNVESNNGKYVVSLTKCTCKDYQVRKKPCKHMMRLGIELGLLQYADDSDIISKLNDLDALQREFLRDKQHVSELYTTVDYRCKRREERCKTYIQSCIKDACKDFPEEYVASLISGLSDIFDDELIYYLDTKDHPAYLTAADIKNYYKKRNSKLVFRLTKAESELKHCQKKLKDMQKQTNEQTKLALYAKTAAGFPAAVSHFFIRCDIKKYILRSCSMVAAFNLFVILSISCFRVVMYTSLPLFYPFEISFTVFVSVSDNISIPRKCQHFIPLAGYF